jgi:hypothetical protein
VEEIEDMNMDKEYDEHRRREMTDIYAGLAMVGLLVQGQVPRRDIAKAAYGIADALIAERAARRAAEPEDSAENTD